MDVLVPVDGSDCSFEALRFGVGFAREYDATLSVVHVTDYRTEATDDLLDRAREILADEGVDVDPEVVIEGGLSHPGASGKVGQALLDLIEERGYDHVVMGRHGRSRRIEKLLLGSASETVIKGSPVPVTVVPY